MKTEGKPNSYLAGVAVVAAMELRTAAQLMGRKGGVASGRSRRAKAARKQ